MAYEARKVQYCYVTATNRAGAAAKVLVALKEADIDLLGFLGFPLKGGKAQLDLVLEDVAPIRAVAKKQRWKLSKPKRCFLLRGKDEVGAVAEALSALADGKVDVTAAAAVASGDGRYGMVVWVKKKAYDRAAKLLSAK